VFVALWLWRKRGYAVGSALSSPFEKGSVGAAPIESRDAGTSPTVNTEDLKDN